MAENPDPLFPNIPGYTILRKLGQGGMGVVFEAEHLGLRRRVALKMLSTREQHNESSVKRFYREARALARLTHGNIVQIHHIDEHESLPYMTLELVEGTTLAGAIGDRIWPFRNTAELMKKLAIAIHYAHQRDVIHRDLKPTNILLDRYGEPKITDFGIAKDYQQTITQTQEGAVIGTVAYMSPEQARGKTNEIDARTDVYALGVILYEMLCGETPFQGQLEIVLYNVMRTEPDPPRKLNPRVPPALEAICLKCMDKEPGNRFHSGRELADALQVFCDQWRKNDWYAPVPKYRFNGHKSTIWSVAFSPDCQQIVSGSADATVKIWAVNGQTVRTLKGHTSPVTSVAFSPDGKRVASASIDETIRIWDVGLGTMMRCLQGHTDSVLSIAFSPDGRYLVSGSSDKTLKIWDATTGQEVITFRGHTGAVWSVAYSSDSRFIVSGSTDETIKVWEVSTGSEALTLKGGMGAIQSVMFSPDGKWILAGGKNQKIKVWNLTSPEGSLLLAGHSYYVNGASFSPDGHTIVSGGSDNTVRLWDTSTGEEIHVIKGQSDQVQSVAFSSDGRMLASGGGDGKLRIWQAGNE